jgi:acetoin utilization protein AcuB
MKISEIMSTELVTVSLDHTLDEIRSLFEAHQCHHILVVSDNQSLLGVISDRDVLRNICPDTDSSLANNHAIRTLQKKAHQVMTRDVITVKPDDELEEAAARMLDKSISCVPVIDQEETVYGIVTRSDLLKRLCGTMTVSE